MGHRAYHFSELTEDVCSFAYTPTGPDWLTVRSGSRHSQFLFSSV